MTFLQSYVGMELMCVYHHGSDSCRTSILSSVIIEWMESQGVITIKDGEGINQQPRNIKYPSYVTTIWSKVGGMALNIMMYLRANRQTLGFNSGCLQGRSNFHINIAIITLRTFFYNVMCHIPYNMHPSCDTKSQINIVNTVENSTQLLWHHEITSQK